MAYLMVDASGNGFVSTIWSGDMLDRDSGELLLVYYCGIITSGIQKT